jgi:hypothetical protein
MVEGDKATENPGLELSTVNVALLVPEFPSELVKLPVVLT